MPGRRKPSEPSIVFWSVFCGLLFIPAFHFLAMILEVLQ